MPRRRLRLTLAICCALALLTAAGARAALVEVNGLVLHADGGFRPRDLPRLTYKPIDFQGFFDISAKSGGVPSPLQQAVIDFDRDGRLAVAGLPTCDPGAIADASTQQARRQCKGALVGTGQIEVLVDAGFLSLPVRVPLSIFNGPLRSDGSPTALLHARIDSLIQQTLDITVPIERIPGPFRYRVTIDMPPIAGGTGAVTHVGVKIGRRFTSGGKKRSYVSARCSDGVLSTHGRFTFADGTIIDGAVEKACQAK